MGPSHVELLGVREARQASAAPPLERRGWPLDVSAAELRTLPYPFANYAGLSNDCDSGKFTFQEIQAFFGYVRETLNLPFGDSFFPDLLTTGIVPYQPTTKIENVIGAQADPAGPVFRNRIGNYVRYFHLGWFDTVHGFVTSVAVKLAYTEEEEKSWAASAADRDPRSPYTARPRLLAIGSNLHRSRQRFKFYAPLGWERQVPPRYVVLKYRAPLISTTVHIRVFEGDQALVDVVGTSQDSATPLSSMQEYVIDLWPLVGFARPRLHAIEVEVEVTGRDGCFMEIADVFLINRLRGDLKRYQRAMENYNMTTTAFTSHGIGLVMAPTYAAETEATDCRNLADLRANPHYAVDILWDYGLRFFNSYSNTSKYQAMHIDELTFLNCLSDGRVVYDFYRYAFAPKDTSGSPDMTFWHRGGKLINLSLVDALGDSLFGLLSETTTQPGTGGLVYTHTYAANSVDPDQDPELYTRPMNQRTRQALETLTERYYNLSGATQDLERVYLASLPVLLRYSVVRKGLAGRAFYHQPSNTIHIAPWNDPVLNETVPSAAAARELRGITFYVAKAQDARLFIGEREFTELIRNPKDATGRESITLADVSTPLILAGRVPLPMTRATINVAGGQAEYSDISVKEKSEHGVRLTLTQPQASLSVAPRAISAANYSALRIVFAKSDPAIRFGLRLEFDSGLKLHMLEQGITSAQPAHILPAHASTAARTIILPFYLLLAGSRRQQPNEKSPGLDWIAKWSLEVYGPTLAGLHLHALQLLRDCEQKPPADGFVVAGSVKTAQPAIARVRMRYCEFEYETFPTADGIYFFDRKVASDSVVEVYGLSKDNAEIDPANGRFFHIVADKSDIDFALESVGN